MIGKEVKVLTEDKLLTVEETAQKLALSELQVKHLIRDLKLRAVGEGRGLRVPSSAVVAYISGVKEEDKPKSNSEAVILLDEAIITTERKITLKKKEIELAQLQGVLDSPERVRSKEAELVKRESDVAQRESDVSVREQDRDSYEKALKQRLDALEQLEVIKHKEVDEYLIVKMAEVDELVEARNIEIVGLDSDIRDKKEELVKVRQAIEDCKKDIPEFQRQLNILIGVSNKHAIR